MRACGECIYFREVVGMRDHGRCSALHGISAPMWVDVAVRDGFSIVAANKASDSCRAYCHMARPIGAPENWSTPYERWLDEHKEG
jgi:hypothetical protein